MMAFSPFWFWIAAQRYSLLLHGLSRGHDDGTVNAEPKQKAVSAVHLQQKLTTLEDRPEFSEKKKLVAPNWSRD